MQTALQIPVQKTESSHLSAVDFEHLEFGRFTSDHMFISVWNQGVWENPRIIPFGNLSLSPASLALHYGQTVFEGMKAYKTKDGQISVFRLEKHHSRFNRSLERMSMPEVPFDLFHDAITQLVQTDKNWVPSQEGSSLYIRPFMFASESKMGVKISDEFHFMVITSPVGPYYAKPLKVKVEREYVRAAEGGTGYAKCGGNYGASFYPTAKAKSEGFDQVIWTDACGHNFIEESGTMNLMFILNNTLVTPPTSSSVLDGVTRDSILKLAEQLDVKHEVRKISVAEMKTGLENGTLTEAFGAGTAAVVAPISHISIDGTLFALPAADEKAVMFRFRKALNDIRTGEVEDTLGWNTILPG